MALTLNGSTGISGIAGSAGTPALQGNNDANTGYFFAADTLGLSTAGSERLRIEADGQIQIGLVGLTGGNDQALTITEPGGSPNVLELATSNASGRINFSRNLSSTLNTTSYIEWTEPGAQGTGELRFGTSPSSNNPTERLRITSTGQILVGTTSDGGTYDGVTPHFVSEVSSGYQAYTLAVNANHAGQSSILQFVKSRGTSDGANTIVQDGDRLGSIYGIGADGTNRDTGAAAIDFRVDGTPGTNDMPGRIEFRTTNDGAAVPSEKVVIKADGKVGIGTTSPSSKLHVVGVSGTNPTVQINHSNADVTGEFLRLARTDIPTIRYHSLMGQHGGGATANFITFKLHNGSTTTSQSEVLSIIGNGNVKITDGDLVIGTAGHGIDFSAGTGHSGTGGEVLTDFEYGTWTPTLYFLSNNGGITYTTQQGDYTKVGNRVFFSFMIEVNSIGSSAGNVLVWGLPYQVNQPTNGVEAPSSVSLFPIKKLNITGDIFCGQITSQPDIELYNVTWGTGNNYSATQASQIADGFFLKGQGHYCTNS